MGLRNLQIDKLRPRSDKYLFVGYTKKSKEYYFHLTEEQKVFVSNKTFFLEKKFLGEVTDASKVELDKVRQVEEPT